MTKYLLAVIIILSACHKEKAEEVLDMTPIDAKGEILFISRRIASTGDWGMVLMNADGTDQRLISSKFVTCNPPSISNDGKKVAFTTYENLYSNLYVADIDGQNQILLARSKGTCGLQVWSPDDNRIAFVMEDSLTRVNNIYTVAVDGSNQFQLTNQGGIFPQFTPDNNSIIFCAKNNSLSAIYKMNLNGSNKTLLTTGNVSLTQPTISPDGKMIAMTSVVYSGTQIFVMNSDGTNLKQMTFTESPRSWPGPGGPIRDGNYGPAWSPDSKKLAYVSYENSTPDIFVINADGTGNKRLTDSPLRDEHPCWTTDGKYIIFSSNRGSGNSEVYIMRTEGQLQTHLTTFAGDDIYPSFITK